MHVCMYTHTHTHTYIYIHTQWHMSHKKELQQYGWTLRVLC